MSQTLRSAFEERVVAAVREGEQELVALTSELVAFDTTARNLGDPPRQEAELQEHLRRRLVALGADVDVWEPETTGSGNRVVPDGLDFRGRPQLAARLRGAGGGRSLLLNGHIDAVSYEPLDRWASHPLRPEVRDGQLYGRGSCDMKGGIAGMLFALETVTRLGARLAGDVVFCTDSDEESSGAGAYACAAHGVRADAGLCAEPTAFDVWVACRGGVNPTVRTVGRAGHSEMHHPHWRDGGPVNAIEKMEVVLASLHALREDWARRPEHQHKYLHVPDVLPTVIRGGEWMVTYPSSCEAVLSVQYMPGRVDGDRGGQDVFDEVEAWVRAAADRDDWLAEHPPEWEWPCDIVPAEVPDDHPIVTDTLAAGAAVGRPGRISGLDSWHDAAVFTRVAGTPTVSFGPGDLAKAHTIDESVPVADLVDHAAAVALILLRWCGSPG
ncbi:MAG: M20 family metallopeptidase [Deltaproteobacteria bacterium]